MAPELGLELFHPLEQLAVVLEERQRAHHVALDQAMLDEQLPGMGRVDRAVGRAPPGDDGQAEQRDLFEGGHRAGLPLPVGLAVGAVDEVPGQRLDPAGIDPRGGAEVAPCRFDALGGHDPAGPLFEQDRAGPEVGLAAAGDRVVVDAALGGQVGEQPGEDRVVHRVVVVAAFASLQPAVLGQLQQLAMDVEPFPHPVGGKEVLPAGLLQLAAGELFLQFVIEVPDSQIGEEIGVAFGKPGVGLVGGLGLVDRPLAGIADFEGRGDDQDLGQAALFIGGEDHPPDPRIDGHAGEPPPQVGQPAGLVQGPELDERLPPVADRGRPGRIEEGEGLHLAELQGLGLKDHRGEVAAENLGGGEAVAGVVIGLVVEPDADTRPDPSAACARGRPRPGRPARSAVAGFSSGE